MGQDQFRRPKDSVDWAYETRTVINIAHNPMQHDRTKHIEIDRHFIKEKLDSGLICTPYGPTGH